MARFLLWRIAQFPLVLAIIYLVTFFLRLGRAGSPFDRTDRRLPADVVASLKKQMHAESWRSFLVYYPQQLIFHHDFGAA